MAPLISLMPVTLLVWSTSLTTPETQRPTPSPLASYSSEWNHAKYESCHTAVSATYLSQTEKDLIHILNLARAYPALFLNTVVLQYPEKSEQPWLRKSHYYQSLVEDFKKLDAQWILKPELSLFTSASCHASSSGTASYVGHERITDACRDVSKYSGECCHYGSDTEALDILMSLLIDEDVPSLGHRRILLGNFTRIGVAIRPHLQYKSNTVMDLGR